MFLGVTTSCANHVAGPGMTCARRRAPLECCFASTKDCGTRSNRANQPPRRERSFIRNSTRRAIAVMVTRARCRAHQNRKGRCRFTMRTLEPPRRRAFGGMEMRAIVRYGRLDRTSGSAVPGCAPRRHVKPMLVKEHESASIVRHAIDRCGGRSTHGRPHEPDDRAYCTLFSFALA